MNRVHRIMFWRKNGHSLFEAIRLSENELTREVILGIKRIRRENERRKKEEK
ncbi:MAG: hypothetical protein KIT80_23530 [Chitinophagaceae bacterium]|nr:hypothetical protein [Nitrosomonas sp.]MCW5929912.1 hypothetical protein [Chitinophagaceae bacterium]